jgi:magnesium-transporting ATPase (P-type)
VQSYICANTDSLFILALNSLVMGFVRQTLLMCNLFTLIKYGFGIEATRNVTPGNEPKDEKGWDALDTEKKASQPIIYFFFMLLGQIGTWITAWFAYNYHWQMVYYAMLGSILVALLITLVCMPYNPYPTKRSPLSFSKFGNVVVFCLMCSFPHPPHKKSGAFRFRRHRPHSILKDLLY